MMTRHLTPRLERLFLRYVVPAECLIVAVLAAWPWWSWEPAAVRYGLAVLYTVAGVFAYLYARGTAAPIDAIVPRGEKQ